METDIDYNSNYVFIDEAAFHINMKRFFAWSTDGARAIVKAPKTRTKLQPF
jgi:predicted small integral membrane protein